MSHDRESNQRPPLPGAGVMEDYTAAFLCVAGFLCFLALFALWVNFGLPFTLVLAALTDRVFLHR
ncbi:MAG: hypothetical protein LJE68_12360 [Rhodobacter sp.]|nr:hypothetical protein [Rhodobacter sp.]